MKVTLIKSPTTEDLKLCAHAARTTIWRDAPRGIPDDKMICGMLDDRHSPIRLLEFVFRIDGIPSNIATHLCRHVHAQPFVSSLRNDRQSFTDGDKAPRDTPVNMLYAVNAEELMVIANRRLCGQAYPKTREVVHMMCDCAAEALPLIKPYLVPMCEYRGGYCHSIVSCGHCPREGEKR